MNCSKPRSGASARYVRAWLLLALATGCHKQAPEGKPIEVEALVQLTKPEKRDLHHEVGQPGYVYAYEQTSIYPKVSGYIDKWNVDIGSSVKKGQLLAHIFVPELHARFREKKARVVLAEARVRQAEQDVKVAERNVEVAEADKIEAQNRVAKYVAEVKRWQSEVKRLGGITNVVDKQVLVESRLQLESNIAERDTAQSAVIAAEARRSARKADVAKAKVDVEVARSQVKVNKAAEEHLAALVDYTDVRAPYDGIVIVRNVNTGDYVEPRYGDESPQIGGYVNEAKTRGTPLYVVARTDIVRVYVDVPEMQANYVYQSDKNKNIRASKARVRIQALDDTEIYGTVTRLSWALNVRTRTLRAEIDLPNTDERVRPGMYAYALVEIERSNAMTVPMAAVIEIGNDNTVYLHEDGKAYRTRVQTGVDDGKYIEVFRKLVKNKWEKFTGNEEVILGDLAELRNGEKVRIAPDKGSENKNNEQK